MENLQIAEARQQQVAIETEQQGRMSRRKRAVLAGALAGALAFTGAACSTKADKVSDNISTAADNFEIDRRIVFLNGITDSTPLVIEGRCSIEADTADEQLEVTCLIGEEADGDNLYAKHYLGQSDNMSYIVEQLVGVDVDEFHHRVIIRPETLIPNFDLDTSAGN